METTTYAIHLLKGLSDIPFGCSMETAEQLLGKPDEVESFDDELYDSQKITVFYYANAELSLYFEGEDTFSFTSVEAGVNNITLFEKPLHSLNKKGIIALMKEKGYPDFETEEETWGEKRLSFDDGLIDFYFQNDQLHSVNWSADTDI
ncbi:MAG: hypothetical protein M0R21_09320 [Lentimicrobiaceae bacterium]|nr:hypothetical protein [Lentimicrobiaceae bacterium]